MSHQKPFLKEHRKAHKVGAADMGETLGIERESVYRLERHPERATGTQQALYAKRLGIKTFQLWSPPGDVSIDAIVDGASPEIKEMAADIVRRVVTPGRDAD